MVILLSVVSVAELLMGFSIFSSAKSAIHEILGTLMVGFAFLTIGLVAILHELKKNRSVAPAAPSV